MAKSKADVNPLDRLRGGFWVKRCMQIAGVRSVASLHALQDVIQTPDLWSKYRNGYARPQISSVRLLDKQFKGSAKIWTDGPYNLPFWAVLSADPEACHEYLKDYLYENVDTSLLFESVTMPKIRTMPLEDKVYLLIRTHTTYFRDLTFSYYADYETPPWEIEPDRGGISPPPPYDQLVKPIALPMKMAWLTDLVTFPKNFLGDECRRCYQELKEMGRTRYDGRGSQTPKILRYDSLLAFIAAIHLGRSSKNSILNCAAEYIRCGMDLAFDKQLNRDVCSFF